MTTSVLVAGIGNLFLSDDGFGSEVARRLASEPLPEGVRVVDYGIGGMLLAYDLLDGYDALVLVDALPSGVPGQVTVLRVPTEPIDSAPELDAHDMHPVAVLAAVGRLGGTLPTTFVVGAAAVDTREGIGLTAPMAAAVPQAAAAVMALVDDLVHGATTTPEVI